MFTIQYLFEEKGKEPIVVSHPGNDTLLEIAEENGIEIHHNCGGVCACSTCHVYIESGSEHLEEISDKEEDFIDRARNPRLSSRLSCQCLINGASGNIVVTIADQSIIQGE
jgi:2Fe-2S ferredoxin